MTARMLLGLALGIATALPLGAPVSADSPASVSANDGHAYWRELYRDTLERRAAAHQRLETARTVYRDGRQRKRLRGERKRAALAELEVAQAELDAAELELEALPERARRAGVPPGWLRNFED